MTLLAFAEHAERAMREFADDVRVEKSRHRVTCRAKVGKQMFVVTFEEAEPDTGEPTV